MDKEGLIQEFLVGAALEKISEKDVKIDDLSYVFNHILRNWKNKF